LFLFEITKLINIKYLNFNQLKIKYIPGIAKKSQAILDKFGNLFS
jgi:hypothetical protein